MRRKEKKAYWREDRSPFAFVDKDYRGKARKVVFEDVPEKDVPEYAVRLDAKHDNPDARCRILGWMTDDGVLHCWTDADTIRMTDASRMMFSGMVEAEEIDLSRIDTSGMTDMSNMFFECKSLKTADLSGFDTSHADDMRLMFAGCGSLRCLDLSSFDTRRVRDMSGMFSRCAGLQDVNLSSFRTKRLREAEGMFACCRSLEELDISSFDGTSACLMDGMFHGLLHGCRIELPQEWTHERTRWWRLLKRRNPRRRRQP